MMNDEKDPVNCTLFYLVLKKKSVLLGYVRPPTDFCA